MRKFGRLMGGLALAFAVAGWAQIDWHKRARQAIDQLSREPFTYYDIRPAGMGGAFTAVADDENALFLNPAGLAWVGRRSVGSPLSTLLPVPPLSLPPFNSRLSSSPDVVEELADFVKDLSDAYEENKDNMTQAVSAINQVLQEYLPLKLSVGFWNSAARTGSLGLGLVTRFDTYADLYMLGGTPRLRTYSVAEGAFLLGKGFEVLSRKSMRVAVGLALKGIYRGVLLPRMRDTDKFELGALDIYNFARDPDKRNLKWENGIGGSIDIGLLAQFGKGRRLSVGMVWQEALSRLKFGDDWKKLKPRLRLGIAYRPPLTQKFGRQSMILCAEIDDITNEGNRSLHARLRLGVELHVGRRLWIRGGISHGYGTFGLSTRWGSLGVDYAWYAEELRPLGYTGKVHVGNFPDRKHMLLIRGLF